MKPLLIPATMFPDAKTAQTQTSQKGTVLPKCKGIGLMWPCNLAAIGTKLLSLLEVLIIDSLSWLLPTAGLLAIQMP